MSIKRGSRRKNNNYEREISFLIFGKEEGKS